MAIASVQLGSAIATHLFSALGPGGAAFLRLAFAALVLFPITVSLSIRTPGTRLRGHPLAHYLLAAIFGLTVATMNLSFYSALNRVPLGVAVTLEFVGPLSVAVAGSRRLLDLLWVCLAAAGIILLAPWGGVALDPLGVLFALFAGVCWACYILLSARVGRVLPGITGLSVAMLVGAIVLLPVGLLQAGQHLTRPGFLLAGAAVALLSSVIPYSLELEALRSMPTRVFGVLMSLEPAVAALVGFVILRQVLNPRALIALVLVTAASLGASRDGPPPVMDSAV
jgi:inner membrane transporter RhtA